MNPGNLYAYTPDLSVPQRLVLTPVVPVNTLKNNVLKVLVKGTVPL